ncbi:MAG: hypothetical protein ACXQTD_06150 [Candidatus Syntropharchaeia archaeon]
MKTDSDWSSNCVAKIGGWNTNTGWYEISTTNILSYCYDNNILKIEFQTDPATIPQGDYLALKITNNDGSGHVIYTDGNPSVRSPSSDPGYPLSELPTLTLTGMGLIGLVGLLGMRMRRNNK